MTTGCCDGTKASNQNNETKKNVSNLLPDLSNVDYLSIWSAVYSQLYMLPIGANAPSNPNMPFKIRLSSAYVLRPAFSIRLSLSFILV